tara:strand:+ start:396 stop:1202 length:807 start_codon:yes stop_codon:yes gene_type:complete
MSRETKFICHIAPPKTAGQAIQAAFRETRDIRHNDNKALKHAFIKDPPKTALINWGHRWVSEIYTSYMAARAKYHIAAADMSKPHQPAHRAPWPGKIFKKYWMEFLPDEMTELGITECDAIPILTVVRNPFDRLFSIFNYYTQQHAPKSPEEYTLYNPDLQFEEFILSFEDTYFRNDVMLGTCFDHISIENQILATDILKFENLASDFKAFCKKYDLPDLQLKRVNVNPDKPENPVYTKEMIKIVERLFEKDLNEFDYSYDQFITQSK